MPENLPSAFRQGGRMDAPGWRIPAGNYPAYLNNRFRDWQGAGGTQFWQDFFVYTVSVASLAPGASANLNFQIQADSSFELVALNGSAFLAANGAWTIPNFVTVQVTDAGSGRNLFNQPIQFNTIMGEAGWPHILPVSRRFVANSQVNVYVVNNDSTITWAPVQISFIGRKIFNSKRADLMGRRKQFKTWAGPNGRMYAEDFYCYVFNFGTIASGVSVPLTTIIESDSDFEAVLLEQGATRNALTGFNAPRNPALNLQLFDGGAQRNLFSNPTAFYSIAGAGELPFILPITRLFLAKTPVTLTVTNIDSVSYNGVQVALEGRKIFEVDYG